jgi:NitT/TauT family transport system substrate-binding protein
MSATAETARRTPIKVVPHFSRLHEWIALEERYYQDEDLEPEMLSGVMHSVSSHRGDQYKQRPQDLPFAADAEVANSACHWGSACNAGAGMGRFVRDLYTVGRYAIFTRPDSDVQMLCDLRDVPVGIGEMAGSHFTSLQALGQVLPREHIELVHTGGPGRRLLALLEGEVEAANLLDPEIPIAESKGLRKLAQGEFMITFWVHAQIPPEVLGSFFGALRRAEHALQRTPERYFHLWQRNLPTGLEGDYDWSIFGRGERMIFEPYTEEMYEQAIGFARQWGLDEHIKEDRYDELVAPVSV